MNGTEKMIDATYCQCHPEDPRCLYLWKSAASTDSDRIIEGLASLDIRDTEGEVVHPDQLDLTYLDKGKSKLNWNHRPDPGDQIGTIVNYKLGRVRDIVPRQHWDRVRQYLDNIGLWIRARLKRGLKKAEDVWTDLTANPNDHGLGFSLQGTAKRAGGHVTGGMVTNVALTPNPVLADTFAVLAKALATSYARSDQTGFQATVPQDLRDEVISTTVGNSRYGSNPKGGWAFQADAVVGHRRSRDADRNRVIEPVRRSFAMPLGEPVRNVFDTPAAIRALKGFLEYVRSLGPVRGNVLDGSSNYFQIMHGLDATTADGLARFVRQNADKLFRKCFSKSLADYLEEEDEGAVTVGFDDPPQTFSGLRNVERTTQPASEPELSKDLQRLDNLVDRLNREEELNRQRERTQRKRRIVTLYHFPNGEEPMSKAIDELEATVDRLNREEAESSKLNKGPEEDYGAQEFQHSESELGEGFDRPIAHCKKCCAKIVPMMRFCPMCSHPVADSLSPAEPTDEEKARWYARLQDPDPLKRPPFELVNAVAHKRLTMTEAMELIDSVFDPKSYNGMLHRGQIPVQVASAVAAGRMTKDEAAKLLLGGKDSPVLVKGLMTESPLWPL